MKNNIRKLSNTIFCLNIDEEILLKIIFNEIKENKHQGKSVTLWDQVEIVDKEYLWKIHKLKESSHILGQKISWAGQS